MHAELVAGIKKHLEVGDSYQKIKQEVLAAGYSEAEFNAAFLAASNAVSSQYNSSVVGAINTPAEVSTKPAFDPTQERAQVADHTAAEPDTQVEPATSDQSDPEPTIASPSQAAPAAGYAAVESAGPATSESTPAPAGPAPVPAAETQTVPPAGGAPLPPTGEMVSAAFRFVFERSDLLGWSLLFQLASLLFSLPMMFAGIFESTGLDLVLMPLSLIVMVLLSIFNTGAVMYAVTAPQRASYWEGFRWMGSHFWSYVWINLVMSAAVMGGFILLFVPGIIFSIWFVFALLTLMREDKRGTAALLHSRELVRGHWWGVFGRLLLISVLFFVVGAVVGIVGATSPVESSILQTVIGTFGMLITIKALAMMYEARLATAPVREAGSKWWVIASAVAGVLLIPLLAIGSAVFLASLDVAHDLGGDTSIQSSVSNARLMAEIYGSKIDGSIDYSGFCSSEDFMALTERYDIKCAVTETSYVFEALLSTGEYICADSNGVSSIVTQPQISTGTCGEAGSISETDLFGAP